MASAIAIVITVSSVKNISFVNRLKSFVLILSNSYIEPTISPIIAPSIFSPCNLIALSYHKLKYFKMINY